MMKHKATAIKAAISLGVLAYLFWIIDLRETWRLIKQARVDYALLVIVVALFDRLLMAFKWNLLVRPLAVAISFLECIRVYFIGSFLGMFFPTSVGGDIVRLFSTRVEKGEYEKIAASIIVERIVALIALAFFVLLATGLLFSVALPQLKVLFVVALALATLSCAGFMVSLYWLPVGWLDKIGKGRLNKPVEKVRNVITAYQLFRRGKTVLFRYFVLSFLEHFLPVVANYFVACTLQVSVNPLAFFVIIPVILVFARLPISLDGLGIQEGLYVLLFRLAGLSTTDAFSIGLMARFLTVLALLPGGVLFALARRRSSN